MLEQTVRKTSGGSPNVKADLAFRRNGEGIQGSFHFQAAAADIAGTVSNGDIRVFINLETGLGRGMPPTLTSPAMMSRWASSRDSTRLRETRRISSRCLLMIRKRCERRYFMKPHEESRKTECREAFGRKNAAFLVLEHFTIDSRPVYRRLCGGWNTATGN